MKVLALLLTATLVGCANVHVEGTEGSSADSLVKLISTDRSSRLVAIDGKRVKGPVIGSYYVKPGNRELEFQLQTPNASAPGKSFGHGVTALNKFVTTRVDLKAGSHYVLNVDKRSAEPAVVIRETRSSVQSTLASKE